MTLIVFSPASSSPPPHPHNHSRKVTTGTNQEHTPFTIITQYYVFASSTVSFKPSVRLLKTDHNQTQTVGLHGILHVQQKERRSHRGSCHCGFDIYSFHLCTCAGNGLVIRVDKTFFFKQQRTKTKPSMFKLILLMLDWSLQTQISQQSI